MDLEAHIEGVLFYKTEPMKKKSLAEFFGVSVEEMSVALLRLEVNLQGRATRLIVTDTEVQLVTAPELAETIERLKKDELRGDIGKAGAETLAIVLYRGPISRLEIDRIRGVNSTFILRNLLVRGLVERRDHPSDSRSFLYAITPALLAELGVSRREELPQFSDVLTQLEVFERAQAETENDSISAT